MSKTLKFIGAAGATLFAALPAFAQEAAEAVADGAAAATAAVAEGPIKAPTVEQMATMVDKGDTTWMLISSALVLLMSIPALALFYGGLVRTKNMLSLLMQVFMIVSVAALVWVSYGYSLAFTSGGPFIGGLSKAFLAGVSTTTFAATFSNNVYIPEYAFVIFQMTFACITPALIVGAFAERIKFTPLMIFTVLWLTFAYFPIAHMVWYWAGPDFLVDAPTDYGLLWGKVRSDFRRRHGCPHQRRYRRSGRMPHRWQARRLWQGSYTSAQPDHDHDRRFASVGGLVRLQRRFEP